MKNIILISLIVLSSQIQSYSQGCSDAGFCTLEANSSATLNEDNINSVLGSFTVGLSYGSGEYDIDVISPYVRYKHHISSRVKLEAKLTSVYHKGNGISSSGLSDIFVYSTHEFEKASYSIGLKVPLNKGNEKWYNDSTELYYPLPLNYQTSLGTYDLLLGTDFLVKKVHISLALQQPISQNENAFIAGEQGQNSTFKDFQTTTGFSRKGDILTRFSYPIRLSENKLNFSPAMLFIYHLGKDTYTETVNNQEVIR